MTPSVLPSKVIRLKGQLTLQTQLWLPIMPLVIDTFARILFLRHRLEWYAIPDLVTLLVTFAFFTLGLMSAVRQTTVATDDELALNVELVKQRLLLTAVTSMMFAGGVSFYRAIDERFQDIHLSSENGFLVFVIVSIFVTYNMYIIISKYISYVGG